MVFTTQVVPQRSTQVACRLLVEGRVGCHGSSEMIASSDMSSGCLFWNLFNCPQHIGKSVYIHVYIYSSPQHGLFMIVHDSPYWKISSPLKRVDFKPFAATAWITRVCLPLFTAWSAKWCHCIWILTNLYHCWLRMRWWTGRFTGMLSGSSNATYFFPLKPAQWNWEAFDLTLHRLIDFLQRMWSSVKVRLGVLNVTVKIIQVMRMIPCPPIVGWRRVHLLMLQICQGGSVMAQLQFVKVSPNKFRWSNPMMMIKFPVLICSHDWNLRVWQFSSNLYITLWLYIYICFIICYILVKHHKVELRRKDQQHQN